MYKSKQIKNIYWMRNKIDEIIIIFIQIEMTA